jgi:tRNA pseudouridine(38-40) synthase
LEVEYDGTPFMGWQRQKHGLAIQQVFEEAGAKLCGGVMPAAIASGRTDAGVHALGQVVQMELPALSPLRIREALNYHLKPHPIVVLRAAPAPAGWNARFSAISRTYRYVILNRSVWPAVEAGRVWHVKAPLDEAAMQRAALGFLGNHDFSSFRGGVPGEVSGKDAGCVFGAPRGGACDCGGEGAEFFAPPGAQHGGEPENGGGWDVGGVPDWRGAGGEVSGGGGAYGAGGGVVFGGGGVGGGCVCGDGGMKKWVAQVGSDGVHWEVTKSLRAWRAGVAIHLS